ncbi:hypothetical protein [Desulfatitalea tepidiphila]|uniref:hypothetical protein n=1 Tax=Desulfatitalea tepidiphila TaxID=1185843 RepID=UPI0006B5B357|nr:hypothetical protein [Desulfatitalea tepidiphila]
MKNDTPEGGIYIERKVFYSAAYQALSKNGRMVLLALLDARQINPAFKKSLKQGFRADRYVDLDRIKMPYTKLEGVFGLARTSIPRAIDELLAKGFIEIKHAGGTGEHDMTIYALVEDYLGWTEHKIFRQRQRDIRRGYQGTRNAGTDNFRAQK